MPKIEEFSPRSPVSQGKGKLDLNQILQSTPPDQAAGSSQPRLDGPGVWLYCAAAGLFVLAGAAAAVSFTAQYRLVFAARGIAAAAALEAAIPDAAALVFAC